MGLRDSVPATVAEIRIVASIGEIVGSSKEAIFGVENDLRARGHDVGVSSDGRAVEERNGWGHYAFMAAIGVSVYVAHKVGDRALDELLDEIAF